MSIAKGLTTHPLQAVTFTPTADIPAFRFIGGDGATCGAGARAIGVTKEDVKNGVPAAAATYGVEIIEAGAAVTAGAEIESDATGRAIPLASGKSNGVALSAASAAGEKIRVKLS